MNKKYDFAGYATRNDIKCSDGRVIRQNAFADCDHTKVPLVYQHDHSNVDNILGHALLENRNDGVYCYGYFNDTPSGQIAKDQVLHGDITALSIYANKLKQRGCDVLHGAIREVSLVLSGANPGAYIETVIAHDDTDEEEAIIYFDQPLVLAHADEQPEDEKEEEPVETVQDIIDTMDEKQKNVMYALIQAAKDGDLDGADEDAEDADDEEYEDEDADDEDYDDDVDDEDDEDYDEKKEDNVKHNVFDKDPSPEDYLAHAEDMEEIIRDMKRYGSLKESALQHGYEDLSVDEALMHADYGIKNIDMLFPDYQNVDMIPGFASRDMTWVATFMGFVAHTPFSRIKSVFANITEDEARAKGYMKGQLKKDEVFTLLKRTTDPQTIYKKQKLDRDDLVDITSFDVVAWLKAEMRIMLDEEIARACLIGDGRQSSSNDKIKETSVRPIWTDDDFYTIKAKVETESATSDADKARGFIRAAIKARKAYKGSGNPLLFTTTDLLNEMLLLTDTTGRDLYKDIEELSKKLRVAGIVEVPVMEGQTRIVDTKTRTLAGIIVNPADYNIGADQGGSVNLFDDFDIDYNQMKYLIETRCSGALIKPYSAIAVEFVPKA